MIRQLDLRLASHRRRLLAALGQCRDALAYAKASGRDPWEYAVEIDSLTKAGLSPSDLRWMVTRGYLQHATEVTAAEDSQRRFLRAQNLAFPARTCFVLCTQGDISALSLDDISALALDDISALALDGGKIIAPRAAKLSAQVERAPLLPHWDRDNRLLVLGDRLVKRYRVPSPTQELILGVFQEEGWPVHIMDPLPPDPAVHPKTRVHDAIKCLNRNQRLHLIQFRGDGTGEGILWELTGPGRQLA